jgi:hypothetical protein
MTLEAIKEAIQHLPDEQRHELADWLERMEEGANREPATGGLLVAAMQASPYKEVDLGAVRAPLPVRDIVF